MFPDERSEELHHSRLVPGVLRSYSFQRINSADAHVEIVRTDLLNRLGIPVGELRFAGGVDSRVAGSPGRSASFPLMKVAPARTSATRCGALTMRQWSCADSISLNAMASPAARDPGPLVILVRCRTVAKVDSIGLVVRRCTRCSAG